MTLADWLLVCLCAFLGYRLVEWRRDRRQARVDAERRARIDEMVERFARERFEGLRPALGVMRRERCVRCRMFHMPGACPGPH